MKHIGFIKTLFLAAIVLSIACSLPELARQPIQTASPTLTVDIPTATGPVITPATSTQTEVPTQTTTPTQINSPTPALVSPSEVPTLTVTPTNLPPTPIPPTPTASPTPDLTVCLAGSWEPVDLSPFVLASISPDIAEKAQLSANGSSGKLTVTFSRSGRFILHAESYKLFFNARVLILTLPMEIGINGTAVGRYRVDGQTLTTEDTDTTALFASAKMSGKDLLSSTEIIDSIPLLRPPYNTAGYSCSGDTLQLKISAYPDLPPLVLKRVE